MNSFSENRNEHQDVDAINLHDVGLMFASEAIIGATSVEPCQWRGKETILLVEDESFVRKATAEVLESAGYQVLLAASAAQALETERDSSEFVDLLLADIVMPGKSGHELAAEFLTLHPQQRILLMSGHEEQLKLTGSSPDRKQCLAKPFSIPTLLRRVREVLDKNLPDLEASP